jgi:hypothetical protein
MNLSQELILDKVKSWQYSELYLMGKPKIVNLSQEQILDKVKSWQYIELYLMGKP